MAGGMTQNDTHAALKQLVWPMRLTLIGLWAERLARAFWPLWTVLITALAALAFGVQDYGPVAMVWGGLGVVGLAALLALVVGLRRFHRPTPAEALTRLDTTLPGRPIAALQDTQAIGTTDPASMAVWQAHLARMAARAAGAKPVAPDLRLSSRDPYALRYLGLTALVMALLFGSLWRVASLSGMAPGAAEAMQGPTWEGWAQPPAYTGKPSLYLNDITAETLTLPAGSRIQLRTYGEVGALSVTQSVSGIVDAAAKAPDVPVDGTKGLHDFVVLQTGKLSIDGPGGRAWQIIATPDTGPTIAVKGEVGRESDGRFKQGFTATDDYGVTSGQVTIALDLSQVDRRFGLTIDPEPMEPVVLDLPLPLTGKRTDYTETLIDDLSEHAFANLPVILTFAVNDAAGQTGTADPLAMTLPGKRFFDPLAAAIIELRRDILWNRANAPTTTMILKAITNRPEGFIRNEAVGMRLRVALRDLDVNATDLTTEKRDALAKELWALALLVEEGDLANALERLRRSQDKLDEAIRNGASPEEIEKLMQEMQQALNEYTRELAEQSKRDPNQQQQQNTEGMQFSADQMQQMLDKLEQLMKEGRTAEAAELMEKLRQLMENMQVTEGEGGQGQGQGKSMQGLSETLRDQQGLSDDAFRDLQQGQQEGQPGEGQNPGQEQQGEGQDGQGEGQEQGSLTDRQRSLRERLNDLQSGQLPGDGSKEGEAGRQELDRAGRAMEEAEQALRDGDLPGAMDRQADAMEALREGMRNFGDALAQEQRQQGTAQQGDQPGAPDPNGQRDPLGRDPGNSARIGSDRNMLQEDPGRRAQALLDEIRRRSGEQTRPGEELDYLRRLLDMF